MRKQPGLLILSLLLFALVARDGASDRLYAEIERVTFTWQAPLCLQSCEQQLNQQLARINGVAQVTMLPGSGAATLTWKPSFPFSFFPLNAATRMVGIRIHNVHIRVRGMVESGPNNSLKLRSTGDGTVLNLISPPSIQPGQAVPLYNPQAYPVAETLRLQLVEQQRLRQPVTIDGLILEPERAPPLYLVIEKITLDDKKTSNSKSKR